MDDEINKYDVNGNEIYTEYPSVHYKVYRDFDDKGNIIHFKNNRGVEWWQDFDDNGNIIHFKNNEGKEIYKKCNADRLYNTI